MTSANRHKISQLVTVVLKNGQQIRPEDATVSVFDRGFMYGDLVFEVLRSYGGRPFRLEAHLDRLAASGARLGFVVPSHHVWRAEVAHALAGRAPEDSALRLIATRGVGLGLDPAGASDPTRFVIAAALPPPPDPSGGGVAVVTRPAGGRACPDAKSGDYLGAVLHTAAARSAGVYEALLVHEDEAIREGATSNVFGVKGRRLVTPPLDGRILPGVTRAVVLGLAEARGMEVEWAPLELRRLDALDELFLTASLRELVPVVSVDGRPVGSARPGPVFTALVEAFRALVRE